MSEQAPRKVSNAERAVRRWAVVLAAILVLALALHSVLVAAGGILALLAVAGFRLHSAHRTYRAGGNAAKRQRAKFQGWASSREIRRLRGKHAALTRLLCPGAGLLELGRAPRKGTVAVCRENSALFVGPPGYGKTATLACHAADAPGLLFATSTKTELLLDTLPYRHGPVWVLNADGYGGIPSTLAWSPAEGCEDPRVAIRRAGDLMAASPRDPSGKDAWHEDRGAQLIRYMLHAAATAGAGMREAGTWVRSPLSRAPMAILESRGAPGWDRMLAALIDEAGDSLPHVVASARAALGWMDDPVMAAAACPLPGEGFSAREFARGHGSVYLIGKKRPHGSLAPYFAALGAEVFEQLKVHAMESPSGGLPVPATFVLDEMPLTCPMPLHDMLAEARGPLVQFLLAAQTLAQLRAKFGKDDGDTIRSACPVEAFFGGEKRADDLADVSRVIGDVDTWHHVTGTKGARAWSSAPLMPPEALHRLAKGKAVLLLPGCRPVLAGLPAIWDRPGHARASFADVPVPARLRPSRPAISAPRGELHRPPVHPPIRSRACPRAAPDRGGARAMAKPRLTPRRRPLTSLRGARFHCAGCGKDFRGHRAMNAHHLAQHAGRWGSKKARATARAMGKEADRMRRHARGWLEAAGLRDPQGKATAKARSRPVVRGKVGWRDLRPLHQHDRDHERAEAHHRRADQAGAKGNRARQADHHHRAGNLRNRWPERPRQPQPARPAPSEDRLNDLLNRAAGRGNGNGTRPAPASKPRTR